MWSSGFWSDVCGYPCCEGNNSLPSKHDFVQCYGVEIFDQISEESTHSPAGYGALYCRKWLTKFRIYLLHLQQILEPCIVNKSLAKFLGNLLSLPQVLVLYYGTFLTKFLRNLLSLPQIMAL